MADITFSGFDEMIRALDAAGKLDDAAVQDILEAGANVALDEIRGSVRRSRYKISNYAEYIQKSRVKRRRDGDPYISIYPNGKNERGVKRATILFVLNYGRRQGSRNRGGEIDADYFWTNASKRAQDRAAKAMEDALTKKLKQEGL